MSSEEAKQAAAQPLKVEVIKRGVTWEEQTMERTCTGGGFGGGGCRSVLKVPNGSLEKGIETDYGGGRDPWTAFRCPVCNKLTQI